MSRLPTDIGLEPAPDPTGVAVAPAPPPTIEGGPAGPPSVDEPIQAPDRLDMFGGSGVKPTIRMLRRDELEEQALTQAPDSSLLDTVAAGMRLENTVTQLFDVISGDYSKPDFERVEGHVPDVRGFEQYKDRFIESDSPQEDDWIKNQIAREQALREEAGITGSIIGAISDPTAWLTGAYGAARGFGVKGIATIEAGTAAATEAQLQAVQEARTASESMFNIAAAGIVTGILGGAAVGLSRAERASLERELARAMNGKLPKTDPETGEIIKTADSVGAASVVRSIEENTMVGGRVAETAAIGPGARLLSTTMPEVRELAQRLVDMPFALVRHAKGSSVGPSVEARLGEYTKMWYRSYEAAQAAFKTYRANGGKMKWREFDNEVGKAMRRNDNSVIPEVAAAAAAWRKPLDDIKNRAIEAGALPQNVKVKYADSYFPRALDFEVMSDPAPLREVVFNYQRNTVGLPENEAWEIADYVSQNLTSGRTIPNGVIPVPQASGTKARSFAMRDADLEPYLQSAASDVLARHFREMGAEIELRAVFGIDASVRRQREALLAEYTEAKKKYRAELKRRELKHGDIKAIEAKLAADPYQGFPAGQYRAWAVPGTKMEENPLGPIVSTSRKKGSFEIDLRLNNPLVVEGLEKIDPNDILAFVKALSNHRMLGADFRRMVEDSIKALPKKDGVPAPRAMERLEKRIWRQMHQMLTKQGYDAIQFTSKNGKSTRYILLDANKARRAPTKEEVKLLKDSLRKTLASHRSIKKFQEEWAETEKFYKEQLKKMPRNDRTLHQAVDEEIRNIESKYAQMMDAAPTDAIKKKLGRELDNVRRDLRGLIGRIQGHHGRPADATNKFVRAGRLARGLSAATSLGGVVITSLAEIARPIFQYGLQPYAKGLMLLATDIKAMSASKRELQRMGAALEVVTQQRLMNWMGEDGVGMMSKSQQALEKGVGLWTGLSHWTEAVKSFTGIISMDELSKWILRAADGQASTAQIEKMARAGISLERAKAIAAQLRQYSDTSGPIRMAHTDDWADRDAAMAFEAAIRSEVNMIALEPGMADKWLWTTSSEVGKLVSQFQSFAQGATNRALVSGLQRADTAFYSGLVVQAAMGTAVMAIKDLSLGRDPTERSSAELLGGGIDRSGILGVWQKPYDLAYNLYNSNSPKNWGDREVIKMVGPTLGRTLPNMFTLAGSIAKGEPDIGAGLDLVPYNDLLHIRRFLEQTLEPPWSR